MAGVWGGLCVAAWFVLPMAVAQLAMTPPRGWNSWDAFEWHGGNLTEDQFRATAQAMQANLLPFGYDTVTADEFWELQDAASGQAGSIDGYGRALPDVRLWPSSAGGQGFKPVAEYVHSLGLKMGIHVLHTVPLDAIRNRSPILNGNGATADQIAVPHPCPWNQGWFGVNLSHPAGQAYIDSVYALYAQWGIDFIKNDCTFAVNMDASNILAARAAMEKTGRDFIYSLSPGGSATVSEAQAINTAVHLYRVTDDWHGPQDQGRGWQDHLLQAAAFASMIGAPGYKGRSWPDLDMLAMSIADDASQLFQMTLWCIARSPLVIGADVRNKTASDLWYYTNPEVLQVNSASTNNRPIQNSTVTNADGSATILDAVWAASAESEGGNVPAQFYVALMNAASTARTISVPLAAVGAGASASCSLRDLWARADLAPVSTFLNVSVTAGSAKLFALSDCQS